MNIAGKQFNWSGENGNNTQLLRIGVIFLSVVSFFTTANGMSQYIFNNNIIAYAASAAIQGILLALSMNLPGYLINMWKKSRTSEVTEQSAQSKIALAFWGQLLRNIGIFLWKTAICGFAILLTLITIFCSSWFSYIYIADVIHQDSWGADSELLVQQTYRTELYNAWDYAHAYRIYLEESVGRKILLLEEQTMQLADSSVDLSIDWEEDKEKYVSNGGTTAASYMATVIKAMEKAMPNPPQGSASQEDRDLAAAAIMDAKANIADRIESIQQNQDVLNNNITNYSNQRERLQSQIDRGTDDANMVALNNSISNYTKLIGEASQRQIDLEIESMQLDSALERLAYYESQLGLSSSTSSISIRIELLQLQSEFFAQEPDEEKMLNIATDIFTNLRNAASKAADGEVSEDPFSNTNLLIQMNQLIQNLKDYSEIKEIELNLDKLIAQLRNMEIVTESGLQLESEEATSPMGESKTDGIAIPNEMATPTASSSELPVQSSSEETNGVSVPTNGAVPADFPASPVQAEAGEQIEAAIPTGLAISTPTKETESAISVESATPTGSNKAYTGSSAPISGKQDNQWQSDWKNMLTELKAQISAMPVYSVSEDAESETGGVLLESQMNTLLKYNRELSNERLDEMIRRYISNHNAIYQGIIYLQSPYRSLAIFALVLALSFDLSGFIFGFVAQGNSLSNENEDVERTDKDTNRTQKTSAENKSEYAAWNTLLTDKEGSQTTWSIFKTLHQYIVLTGDYESRDGDYYYKTFKDGLLYHWAVKDTTPYAQGIYIQEEIDDEWSKGKMLPEGAQELLFARQLGGPKDGIYRNCQLVFEEGSLILFEKEQQKFLTSIDEYVPVHCYSPNKGENRTIPVNQLVAKKLNDKLIVVALNTKGTRVVAIYIIEQS